MAWSSYHRSFFFYFGRKNRQNNVTTIKFSTYEALSIIDEVSRVLKEVDSLPRGKQSSLELIPYFREKSPDRAFQHENQDPIVFWRNADLILPSVRIRFAFNRISGSYELHMHCPVDDSIKRDHLKNWLGPVQVLGLNAMHLLVAYLEQGVQKALYEPSE